MKKFSKKAITIFAELSKQLSSQLNINEMLLDFDMVLFENQEVYLWDRKHGLEKINTQSEPPNLGWTIIDGSSKSEATRFSCVAIHNKTENTLDVYQATMQDVKMWKAYLKVWFDTDYSHATSSAGLSGA